jgi:ABC-type Fe3+ transport system substrate-binding protein
MTRRFTATAWCRRLFSFAAGSGGLLSRGRVARPAFLPLRFALHLGLALAPITLLHANARVVILTPHVDAIRHEFGRGFAQWHQVRFGEPAEVDWRNVGGTSDALRFLLSEYARKTNGIGVDLLFGGGQEPYLVLADKKLVTPYQPPAKILDGIPQHLHGMDLYDPNFDWYAAALSSFGILENTRVQRMLGLPFARRWDDLANPKLVGWVGVGDPRKSGTMNVMFESFLQAYGWERGWQLLTHIGGNARRFDPLSSSTAKDVALGETAYAFAIDFYGFSQMSMAGRTNLTFVLPDDFTALNADCIAILKGPPNLITARRFIDFVLSEAGQKLWLLPRGYPEGPQQFSIERMPLRPELYKRFKGVGNIEFSPFDLQQTFTYNSRLSRDRRDVVAALAGALLVDAHDGLRSAWRAVIARGMAPGDLAELGRMPISEAEALKLATGAWKNPALRNAKKIEWQRWAEAKYRQLARGEKSVAAKEPTPR